MTDAGLPPVNTRDGGRYRLLQLAIVPAALALLLTACTAQFRERSAGTMDTGRPVSAAMQAYDVLHYTLRHDVLVDDREIAGSASIRFVARREMKVLELDFDGEFDIDRIEAGGLLLDYRRNPEKLYVELGESVPAETVGEVTVFYAGRPVVAENAPWEGGFVWSKTENGQPWIATALQGEGCDIWWPCKDHPSGESLGADLHFTVPEGLTAVSNGVLVETKEREDGRVTFHWRTRVPTNTYGIALNVGPYVLIESSYTSSNGTEVPIRFWALEENEARAREFYDSGFKAAIEFFERRIGPYPWGEEKLGVVETPHFGMDHQTINAYGNRYRRQPYGYDYILHHELAHEWFGNLMTHATVSDLWLHEGLATYMQPLFAREALGDVVYHALMYRSYLQIKACYPIAPRAELSDDELFDDSPLGSGPGADVYAKGAWIAHSLRYLIGDETFWRSISRLVYGTVRPEALQAPIAARFRTTDDFAAIVSDEAGQDLGWFFEVYARRGPLPVIDVLQSAEGVQLEWRNTGEIPFPMPVPVEVNGRMERIEFNGNRARLEGVKASEIRIDPGMRILRKLDTVPTCEERREEADPPQF